MAGPTVLRLQPIVPCEIAGCDHVVVMIGAPQAGTKGHVIPNEALLERQCEDVRQDPSARACSSAIERLVNAEATAAGAPVPPGSRYFEHFALTVGPSAGGAHRRPLCESRPGHRPGTRLARRIVPSATLCEH